MMKEYLKPSTDILSTSFTIMTQINVTSDTTEGPGTEVDPIHPRDPGESLSHERNELEEFLDSNNDFHYGSLW